MKGEKISTTSVLDSEESLEDDIELDLEATLDDNQRIEQVPLFINFTCTIKNKLEHSSVSVRSVTPCLRKFMYISNIRMMNGSDFLCWKETFVTQVEFMVLSCTDFAI